MENAMNRETLVDVLPRIHPPAGFTDAQMRAACVQAAKGEAGWAKEAEAIHADQPEQRKYYILKHAVKARDAILGRDR